MAYRISRKKELINRIKWILKLKSLAWMLFPGIRQFSCLRDWCKCAIGWQFQLAFSSPFTIWVLQCCKFRGCIMVFATPNTTAVCFKKYKQAGVFFHSLCRSIMGSAWPFSSHAVLLRPGHARLLEKKALSGLSQLYFNIQCDLKQRCPEPVDSKWNAFDVMQMQLLQLQFFTLEDK